LISILIEILPDPPTIIEAETGLELIQKTRISRPHIGFVDIRMPNTDGLEAIARAAEFAPNTLWVVLSGHADFSYAQQALKLGVEDFLLKPPDPGELSALVNRLMQKARTRQRQGNHELEAKVSGILGETTSVRFDSYFAKPRFWQASLVYWDSMLGAEQISPRRRGFAERLTALLDEQSDYSGCVVSMKDGALLIVFSTPAGGPPMDRVIDLWNRRFHTLRNSTLELTGEEIGETWLLTQVTNDAQELFEQIERLSTEASLRYVHRPHSIMKYSEFLKGGVPAQFMKTAAILEDLRQTWEIGREDDFHGLIHVLQKTVESMSHDLPAQTKMSWYARYIMPLGRSDYETIIDLANHLHDQGHLLFAQADSTQKSISSLVDQALIVMNRRYRETIGVAQVADELGVTSNYLSTVFKKETGMSFTRRLTELRLEKGAEILNRPGANIGETARSLGYQSSRHFTRLFKDRFGVTPSDWITLQRN
ncbi:MAG: AraC family transcriptional regulator, partial [Spirochaetaceae bacterium]|nr:AraC family transcriptional regulator [Spirochaetaceae bacterium]